MMCLLCIAYSVIGFNTDDVLLADVLEHFTKYLCCRLQLGLVNYMASPSLSGDAMMLMSGVKTDLITDLDMLDMVDNEKRGGLCLCGSRQYAKTNSRYLPDWNPNEEDNYIRFWIANALCYWPVVHTLPYKCLRLEYDVSLGKILRTSDEGPIGYVIQVDLELPTHLHYKFNNICVQLLRQSHLMLIVSSGC